MFDFIYVCYMFNKITYLLTYLLYSYYCIFCFFLQLLNLLALILLNILSHLYQARCDFIKHSKVTVAHV